MYSKNIKPKKIWKCKRCGVRECSAFNMSKPTICTIFGDNRCDWSWYTHEYVNSNKICDYCCFVCGNVKCIDCFELGEYKNFQGRPATFETWFKGKSGMYSLKDFPEKNTKEVFKTTPNTDMSKS